MTESKPDEAIAAPTKPPTKVCDELDGKPNHQVIKFQIIAAISADAITERLITFGSMIPLPMVVATFKLKIAKARKLNAAAKTTAAVGESTRVETMVAMEFAES